MAVVWTMFLILLLIFFKSFTDEEIGAILTEQEEGLHLTYPEKHVDLYSDNIRNNNDKASIASEIDEWNQSSEEQHPEKLNWTQLFNSKNYVIFV